MPDAVAVNELERLLMEQWSDLLAELGSGGTDAFPGAAIEKGLRLLTNLQARLRTMVCGDRGLRDLVDTKSDDLTIAGAVYDLIAGSTGHLPAASVAVLLVKVGISDYCAAVWD